MVALSLDSLTLTETKPAELIRSAAAGGYELISLWVQPPPMYASALLDPADAAECLALLRDTGVKVWSLEAFDLIDEAAIEAARPALEMGARFGGKAALVLHFANPDHAHAAALLAQFVETAAEYGLAVNVEPVATGHTATLADARDLIRASGADAGILFDAWHLVRTGGGLAELQAIEPELIRYVQLNDGAATCPPEELNVESLQERLYPGDGVFPLVELLRATPRDVPWGIEAPSLRRANAGVSAAEQAIEAMAATKRILAALD